MSPPELLPLGLYLVQQLGVMLGVGASSVMLVTYLVAMRDGAVEASEAHFARVVKHVLEIGLVCIVFSGALITAMHWVAGEYDVISSPAFFFKWILIAVVCAALVLHKSKPFAGAVWEGCIGATWYALFILHTIAPVALWSDLLFLYAAWLAGFMLLWVSLARLITARTAVAPKPIAATLKSATPAPAPAPRPVPVVQAKVEKPKVQQPPPPPPAVAESTLPVIIHDGLSAPHKPEPVLVKAAVPVKPAAPHAGPPPIKPPASPVLQVPSKPDIPATDPDFSPGLPAIRVMPRTPEDITNENRASIVQFT